MKKIIFGLLIALNAGCCILSRSGNSGPHTTKCYPATQVCWEVVGFPFEEHTAASGDYMLIPYVFLGYPFALVELPVQCVLDTVLYPYDIIHYKKEMEKAKKQRIQATLDHLKWLKANKPEMYDKYLLDNNWILPYLEEQESK